MTTSRPILGVLLATVVTIGAAIPAEASQTTDAARLVEAYYTFQGNEATAQQLVSGIPAARALFDEGFPNDSIEGALIRLFRDSDRAAWAPFEDVVPQWVRKNSAQILGTASWEQSRREEPVVVVEPEPVEVPEPVVVVEAVEEVEPEVDVIIEEDPDDEPAVVADLDTPRDRSRPSSKGLTKKQRKGVIGTGVGMLVGGMLGGMFTGVAHGYGCDFWPGGAPVIGLIPLAGPLASHSYWVKTNCDQDVSDYFLPFAIGITVLELAGVTMIIIGAAAPKKSTRRSGRTTVPHPRLLVMPAFSPDSAGLALQGRF